MVKSQRIAHFRISFPKTLGNKVHYWATKAGGLVDQWTTVFLWDWSSAEYSPFAYLLWLDNCHLFPRLSEAGFSWWFQGVSITGTPTHWEDFLRVDRHDVVGHDLGARVKMDPQ